MNILQAAFYAIFMWAMLDFSFIRSLSVLLPFPKMPMPLCERVTILSHGEHCKLKRLFQWKRLHSHWAAKWHIPMLILLNSPRGGNRARAPREPDKRRKRWEKPVLRSSETLTIAWYEWLTKTWNWSEKDKSIIHRSQGYTDAELYGTTYFNGAQVFSNLRPRHEHTCWTWVNESG